MLYNLQKSLNYNLIQLLKKINVDTQNETVTDKHRKKINNSPNTIKNL